MSMTEDAITHVSSVRDLLDDYIVCRTFSHSWDDDPTAEYTTIFNWTASLRCTRCGTTKIEAYNAVGDVIYRRYVYPDGYRVAGTRQGGRVTKAQMRVELMRRRVFLRRRPSKRSR